MNSMNILTLDKNWVPHQWIPLEEAMVLEAKGLVLQHEGEAVFMYSGGINRITEKRSELMTSSIIVVDGAPLPRNYRDPALTNTALFARDQNLCAYCGGLFKHADLTRDHIVPRSKGGKDVWMNVVTSCKTCNSLKGDVMPGEKLPFGAYGPQMTHKMDPLFVPYVPCKAEHMLMRGRNVKADQMVFLLGRIKNKALSRVYADGVRKLAAQGITL